MKPSRTLPTGTFNVQAFLDSAGAARRIVEYRRADVIFAQGDPCEHVLYIQTGSVKISVLSKTGREAVVAMLGPGDFFGEGGLAGQPVRMGSATASSHSSILVEEDLVNQLFNSSEKRLARTLLLLARYRTPDAPAAVDLKISQETLAEMVGTTRSRVNFFMNKFKQLGFIDYKDGLRVHDSLLAVVLHDSGSR